MLRLQTIHTENTPEKGTTIYYLQQKTIQLLESTQNNSPGSSPEKNLGSKCPGVRSVLALEILEGKLVGIHKEGNEEPFYTVSLSSPISGAAGNTVREVQTSGYR